jgi:hypothetical protein
MTARGHLRSVLAVSALLLTPVAVVACTAEETPPPAENTAPNGTTEAPLVTTFPVTVNGKQVWCVWAEHLKTYDSGLSCDFNASTR